MYQCHYLPHRPKHTPHWQWYAPSPAATLLGAKTQWPLLVRIEQQCTEVCRDRIEDLVFRGECLEEDRQLTLAEYLQQLDNPEPFGTSLLCIQLPLPLMFALNCILKKAMEQSTLPNYSLGMTG